MCANFYENIITFPGIIAGAINDKTFYNFWRAISEKLHMVIKKPASMTIAFPLFQNLKTELSFKSNQCLMKTRILEKNIHFLTFFC